MIRSAQWRAKPVALAVWAACANACWAQSPDDATVAFRTLMARNLERAYSNAAAHSGALAVQDTGVRGAGVRINVIDTGVRASHADFSGGKVITSASRDLTLAGAPAGSGMTDGHGHGTFVASVIAGSMNNRGIIGIAPDARIISSEAMSAATSWSASGSAIQLAVRNGVNGGAFIHNLSMAGTGPVGEAALREAVWSGTLAVVAAGNRGLANPDWPARYAKEAWANNQIIAVGAVNPDNTIASFSNRAGDTADWYVVALGVNVIGASASSDTGLAIGNGTSMATPIVSGVAALIKSRWPSLQASQVGQIIFATATDLGAPGVDTVYGHGLVNAQRAMQPVGATGTVSAAGVWNFNTQGTLITASSTLGSRLSRVAANGQLDTIVFDSFHRDFALSLSSAVATPRPVGFEGLAAGTDRQIRYAEKTLDALGSRLLIAAEQRTDLQRADGLEIQSLWNYEHRFRQSSALLGAAWVQKFQDGSSLTVATGGMNAFFGLPGMDSVSTQPVAQGLQSPMLGLLPLAQTTGFGLPLGNDWSLKLGYATSQGAGAVADQLGITGGLALKQSLGLMELNRSFDEGRTMVGVQFASLDERESLLGTQGFGLTAMNGVRATTQALTLQGATRLSENLVAGAQFSIAHTPGTGNSATSLVTGTSALTLTGWGVGITRFSAIADDDRVAFTVSEPLAVRSGEMRFDLPTRVDASGNPLYRQEVVGLGSSTRERLYEATWVLPLADHRAALVMSGIVRQHALGNPDAPTELLGSVRYQQSF
ncbi:MAG: S8 family peptidase [Burkholderiales bacterium]